MTPVDVRDVIVQSLMGSARLSQVDREAAADAILKDLTRAGVEVIGAAGPRMGLVPGRRRWDPRRRAGRVRVLPAVRPE